MSVAIRMLFEPVRSIGFAAVGFVYSTVGTPMTKPIRMLVLQNSTNSAIMLSVDGVHDHLPMVANGYLILDITSNKTLPQGFFLAEGQQLYVKTRGALPTSGFVDVSVIYGAEL